jgi:hypothetical protein
MAAIVAATDRRSAALDDASLDAPGAPVGLDSAAPSGVYIAQRYIDRRYITT